MEGEDMRGEELPGESDTTTDAMEKGSLSPLTGSYLLIVLAEPHSDEDREIILDRLSKGLSSWDVASSHVDLNCELLNLTNSSPEGDEARNGEKLVQWASENLVVEVLIHSQVNTLQQCMKNLLASFTRHRHIIHAGYTFQGSGSWVLQDGTFSFSDFIELWGEGEVQRILGAYKGDISVSMHCASENGWTEERLSKEPFAKLCQITVNPTDHMSHMHNAGMGTFIEFISKMLVPTPLKEILEPSDIVGNIRFSHPTLYVFPGGQGDAALFGINGFNMLIDGGFARKACFWDFTRHLDRLDAVLLTRINNNSVGGLSSVIQRKVLNQVYPQIGHIFANVMERKGGISMEEFKKEDSSGMRHEKLLMSLTDEGHRMVENLRNINLKPHLCFRESHIEPINLYHKVGHGKLDLYVLNPARDSREVKEFLSKWNSDCRSFVSSRMTSGRTVDGKDFQFPILNLVSICALLVWQPANPRDPITRILFPGSTPQHKIFEALSKLKHLEFLRYPICSAKTIAASHRSVAKSEKVISEAKEQLSKVSNVGTAHTDISRPSQLSKTSSSTLHRSSSTHSKVASSSSSLKELEKPARRAMSRGGGGEADSNKIKSESPIQKSRQSRLPSKVSGVTRAPSVSKDSSAARVGSKKVDNGSAIPTKKLSPTSPTKKVESKIKSSVSKLSKESPPLTPPKSAKDATNNRRVIEQKSNVSKAKTEAANKSARADASAIKKKSTVPSKSASTPAGSKSPKKSIVPKKAAAVTTAIGAAIINDKKESAKVDRIREEEEGGERKIVAETNGSIAEEGKAEEDLEEDNSLPLPASGMMTGPEDDQPSSLQPASLPFESGSELSSLDHISTAEPEEITSDLSTSVLSKTLCDSETLQLPPESEQDEEEEDEYLIVEKDESTDNAESERILTKTQASLDECVPLENQQEDISQEVSSQTPQTDKQAEEKDTEGESKGDKNTEVESQTDKSTEVESQTDKDTEVESIPPPDNSTRDLPETEKEKGEEEEEPKDAEAESQDKEAVVNDKLQTELISTREQVEDSEKVEKDQIPEKNETEKMEEAEKPEQVGDATNELDVGSSLDDLKITRDAGDKVDVVAKEEEQGESDTKEMVDEARVSEPQEDAKESEPVVEEKEEKEDAKLDAVAAEEEKEPVKESTEKVPEKEPDSSTEDAKAVEKEVPGTEDKAKEDIQEPISDKAYQEEVAANEKDVEKQTEKASEVKEEDKEEGKPASNEVDNKEEQEAIQGETHKSKEEKVEEEKMEEEKVEEGSKEEQVSELDKGGNQVNQEGLDSEKELAPEEKRPEEVAEGAKSEVSDAQTGKLPQEEEQVAEEDKITPQQALDQGQSPKADEFLGHPPKPSAPTLEEEAGESGKDEILEEQIIAETQADLSKELVSSKSEAGSESIPDVSSLDDSTALPSKSEAMETPETLQKKIAEGQEADISVAAADENKSIPSSSDIKQVPMDLKTDEADCDSEEPADPSAAALKATSSSNEEPSVSKSSEDQKEQVSGGALETPEPVIQSIEKVTGASELVEEAQHTAPDTLETATESRKQSTDGTPTLPEVSQKVQQTQVSEKAEETPEKPQEDAPEKFVEPPTQPADKASDKPDEALLDAGESEITAPKAANEEVKAVIASPTETVASEKVMAPEREAATAPEQVVELVQKTAEESKEAEEELKEVTDAIDKVAEEINKAIQTPEKVVEVAKETDELPKADMVAIETQETSDAEKLIETASGQAEKEAPETSEKAAIVAEQVTVASEKVPEVPENITDASEKEVKASEKLEEAPKKTEEAPEKTEEASEKVEKAPQKVEKAPEKVENAPEKVEKAPEKVEKAPEKVEKAPEKVEKAPEKVDETPEKAEEVPETEVVAAEKDAVTSEEDSKAPGKSEAEKSLEVEESQKSDSTEATNIAKEDKKPEIALEEIPAPLTSGKEDDLTPTEKTEPSATKEENKEEVSLLGEARKESLPSSSVPPKDLEVTTLEPEMTRKAVEERRKSELSTTPVLETLEAVEVTAEIMAFVQKTPIKETADSSEDRRESMESNKTEMGEGEAAEDLIESLIPDQDKLDGELLQSETATSTIQSKGPEAPKEVENAEGCHSSLVTEKLSGESAEKVRKDSEKLEIQLETKEIAKEETVEKVLKEALTSPAPASAEVESSDAYAEKDEEKEIQEEVIVATKVEDRKASAGFKSEFPLLESLAASVKPSATNESSSTLQERRKTEDFGTDSLISEERIATEEEKPISESAEPKIIAEKEGAAEKGSEEAIPQIPSPSQSAPPTSSQPQAEEKKEKETVGDLEVENRPSEIAPQEAVAKEASAPSASLASTDAIPAQTTDHPGIKDQGKDEVTEDQSHHTFPVFQAEKEKEKLEEQIISSEKVPTDEPSSSTAPPKDLTTSSIPGEESLAESDKPEALPVHADLAGSQGKVEGKSESESKKEKDIADEKEPAHTKEEAKASASEKEFVSEKASASEKESGAKRVEEEVVGDVKKETAPEEAKESPEGKIETGQLASADKVEIDVQEEVGDKLGGGKEAEPLETQITGETGAPEESGLNGNMKDEENSKFIRPLPYHETIDSDEALEKLVRATERHLRKDEAMPSAIPSKLPRESREVIRTPDEVADLPVHEEVDPGTYETDELILQDEQEPKIQEAEEDPGVEAIPIQHIPTVVPTDTKEAEELLVAISAESSPGVHKPDTFPEIIPATPEHTTVQPVEVTKIDAAVSPVLESLLGQSPPKGLPGVLQPSQPTEVPPPVPEYQKTPEAPSVAVKEASSDAVEEAPSLPPEPAETDKPSEKDIKEDGEDKKASAKKGQEDIKLVELEKVDKVELRAKPLTSVVITPSTPPVQILATTEFPYPQETPDPASQPSEKAAEKSPSKNEPEEKSSSKKELEEKSPSKEKSLPEPEEKSPSKKEPEEKSPSKEKSLPEPEEKSPSKTAPEEKSPSKEKSLPEPEEKSPSKTAPEEKADIEKSDKPPLQLSSVEVPERKLSMNSEESSGSSVSPVTAISKEKEPLGAREPPEVPVPGPNESAPPCSSSGEGEEKAREEERGQKKEENPMEELLFSPKRSPGQKLFTLPREEDEEEEDDHKSNVDEEDIYETEEPGMGAVRSGLLTAATTLSAAVISQSPEDLATIPSFPGESGEDSLQHQRKGSSESAPSQPSPSTSKMAERRSSDNAGETIAPIDLAPVPESQDNAQIEKSDEEKPVVSSPVENTFVTGENTFAAGEIASTSAPSSSKSPPSSPAPLSSQSETQFQSFSDSLSSDSGEKSAVQVVKTVLEAVEAKVEKKMMEAEQILLEMEDKLQASSESVVKDLSKEKSGKEEEEDRISKEELAATEDDEEGSVEEKADGESSEKEKRMEMKEEIEGGNVAGVEMKDGRAGESSWESGVCESVEGSIEIASSTSFVSYANDALASTSKQVLDALEEIPPASQSLLDSQDAPPPPVLPSPPPPPTSDTRQQLPSEQSTTKDLAQKDKETALATSEQQPTSSGDEKKKGEESKTGNDTSKITPEKNEEKAGFGDSGEIKATLGSASGSESGLTSNKEDKLAPTKDERAVEGKVSAIVSVIAETRSLSEQSSSSSHSSQLISETITSLSSASSASSAVLAHHQTLTEHLEELKEEVEEERRRHSTEEELIQREAKARRSITRRFSSQDASQEKTELLVTQRRASELLIEHSEESGSSLTTGTPGTTGATEASASGSATSESSQPKPDSSKDSRTATAGTAGAAPTSATGATYFGGYGYVFGSAADEEEEPQTDEESVYGEDSQSHSLQRSKELHQVLLTKSSTKEGSESQTFSSSSTSSSRHKAEAALLSHDIGDDGSYSSGDFSDSQLSTVPGKETESLEELLPKSEVRPSEMVKGESVKSETVKSETVRSESLLREGTSSLTKVEAKDVENGNLVTTSLETILTSSCTTSSSSMQKDGGEKVVGSSFSSEFEFASTSAPSSSSRQKEAEDEDIVKSWGKPLGLPPIQQQDENGAGGPGSHVEGEGLGKGTPKKDKSMDRKTGTPSKCAHGSGSSRGRAHHRSSKNCNPIYVDLAYVPHHGNSNYCDSEFFRLIRARYYVFSGLEPSRQVFDGLLQGKQAWEDKNLEVTIIPTYDTDTLGYWVVDSEDALAEARIDLAPSASRCTINLQDHETSCSAYRLEF